MSKDLPPSRTAEQFVVRFPEGMRDRIAEAAKRHRRSMNAEIISRLQDSFDDSYVTVIEAKARPGPESKTFDFNADEIAAKVVEQIEKKQKEREKGDEASQRMIQPINLDVLRERYLRPGETGIEDLYRRVARMLASVDDDPDFKRYEMQVQKRDNTPHGPKPSSNARKRLPKKS